MAQKNERFLVRVNNFEFKLDREQVEAFDLLKRSPQHYHLIYEHRSLSIDVVHADHKKIDLELAGQSFHIEIKDELDMELDQLGFSAVSTKLIREIKAPMPGLVLDIAVMEGQEVKEGEKLLILEAMKMENSIMIHADAVIKKILVKPGQAVDKGQVLIELE
jgi:biotin carboxyl carrier protein